MHNLLRRGSDGNSVVVVVVVVALEYLASMTVAEILPVVVNRDNAFSTSCRA